MVMSARSWLWRALGALGGGAAMVVFGQLFALAGGTRRKRKTRLNELSRGRTVPLKRGSYRVELASAEILVVVTGMVLLVAGAGLLLGYRARLAALALIGVLVPITVSTHIGVADDPGPLLVLS